MAALAAVLLAACAQAPTTGSPPPRDLPPLIPIEAFFADPDATSAYQVSPDGRLLAWIGVHGDKPALWLRPLPLGSGPARVVAQGLQNFRWAGDARHVLYTADRAGDENSHVYTLDVTAPRPAIRDLTPHPGIRAVLVQVLPDSPAQVLVQHNQRDARHFDLYRIDVESGRQTLLRAHETDLLSTVTDPAGRPIAEVRRAGRGEVMLRALDDETRPGRELLRWRGSDQVAVLAPDASRRGYYLLSDQGRERRALLHLDGDTGRQSLLAEDGEVDIEGIWWSALRQQPWAAWASPGHQRLQLLDPGWQHDLARTFPDMPRRLTLLSTDRSEQLATLRVDRDGERRFLLLDRRSGLSTELAASRIQAYAERLGVTRPVRIPARDGWTLHGYLTEPPGPRPATGRALVLLVHGGPWARDHWDNTLGEVQFLVNRGYAVLQVNYRGSTGYGRRFLQAAVGEFAGRMHDDLLDAVDWAAAQGAADAQRVAIMGTSYGGYAALVGLTFTPRRFACGVDIMGMSDLVSLLEDAPPYWDAGLPRWHRFVGNPALPEQRRVMAAKSPLNRVDQLERALLVIQGRNDVRVREDQSERLVEALRALGKPVTYERIDGAGHQLAAWKWPQRLRAYRAVEDFLAGCLGGRSGRDEAAAAR